MLLAYGIYGIGEKHNVEEADDLCVSYEMKKELDQIRIKLEKVAISDVLPLPT